MGDGVPVPYPLPKFLLTVAIFLAAIKEICHSLLQSVGLRRGDDGAAADPAALWYPQSEADFYASIRSTAIKAIRGSLPTLSYERSDGGSDSGDHNQCMVCLCELCEGQEVRRMPLCCHVFHRDCIDGWLEHSQRTCPLCRAPLVSDAIAKHLNKLREEKLSHEFASWFLPDSDQEEDGFTPDDCPIGAFHRN